MLPPSVHERYEVISETVPEALEYSTFTCLASAVVPFTTSVQLAVAPKSKRSPDSPSRSRLPPTVIDDPFIASASETTWPPVPMVKLPVVTNVSPLKSTVPAVRLKDEAVQPSVNCFVSPAAFTVKAPIVSSSKSIV